MTLFSPLCDIYQHLVVGVQIAGFKYLPPIPLFSTAVCQRI